MTRDYYGRTQVAAGLTAEMEHRCLSGKREMSWYGVVQTADVSVFCDPTVKQGRPLKERLTKRRMATPPKVEGAYSLTH